jgi:hypothetical protein
MPTHNFDSDVTLLHPTLIPPKSWGVAGEAPANYLYNHAPDLVEITNESVDENISSQCMQDHTPTADPDARHDDDSVDNTGPGSEADLCDSSQNPPVGLPRARASRGNQDPPHYQHQLRSLFPMPLHTPRCTAQMLRSILIWLDLLRQEDP